MSSPADEEHGPVGGPVLNFQADLPDADHVHAHHEERGGEAAPAYLVGQIALALVRPSFIQFLGKQRIGYAPAFQLALQNVFCFFLAMLNSGNVNPGKAS